MSLNLTGNGAVYHRVSTDRQDADRQRQSTREWLARHGVTVRPEDVEEDIGWARDEADRRPAFQRLLRKVDERKVNWIVVDALERFGTKNKHQFISYVYRLQEAGCRLYTVNDKEWTGEDLITLIEAAFEAEKSEGEVRKLSDRVLGQMRLLAKEGQWLGGRVPYGMDVVAFRVTPDGLREHWRVQIEGRALRVKVEPNGQRKEYNGERNFPALEADEVPQLRPTTDPRKLDVVRRIFEWYSTESITRHAIALRLNQQRVPAPAFSHHGCWSQRSVARVLANPTYLGLPAWNRSTIGKYTKFVGGRHVSKKPGQRADQAPEDWIIPVEPLFAPVVAQELWDKVQVKLRMEPDRRHRNPRSPKLWLGGLIYCGNCGGLMHGVMVKSVSKTKTRNYGTYVCGTANNWTGPKEECSCKKYRVSQETIENYLLAFFGETGPLVKDVAVAVQQQKNPSIEAALKQAGDAYWRMVERIGGEPLDFDGIPCIHVNESRIVPANDTEFVTRRYRATFDGERQELQDRLADLEDEHTHLTLGLQDQPTQRSKDKVKAHIQRIETEMADLEKRLKDDAEEYERSMSDWRRMSEAWERATAAMESESSARRKAEAVRQVVEKIVVTFEATGKKSPIGRVKSVDVIPKTSREGDLRPCESEYPKRSSRTNTAWA